jgi:hypothetical protein
MGIRVAVVLAAVISLHEHCPTASAGWGNVDWRLSLMRTRRSATGRGDNHVTQLLQPVSGHGRFKIDILVERCPSRRFVHSRAVR